MGITLPTVCQLKRVPVQYFYLLWIDIHSRNLPKIRRRMRSICTGIQEKTFLCEYWIISHLQNRVAHLPSPCVHDFLHRFITCLWMMGEGCSETANSVQRVKKKKKSISDIERNKSRKWQRKEQVQYKKYSVKSFYGACHWKKEWAGNLSTDRGNEKYMGRRLTSSMDKKYWGTFEAPCML